MWIVYVTFDQVCIYILCVYVHYREWFIGGHRWTDHPFPMMIEAASDAELVFHCGDSWDGMGWGLASQKEKMYILIVKVLKY